MIRTGNPAFNDSTFQSLSHVSGDNAMTVRGTVNKTALLLGFAFMSAMLTWTLARTQPELALGLSIFGFIGGIIMYFAIIFKKDWCPVSTPIYALLEGLLLGGLSFMIEQSYPGIAIQAVLLTFGTLFAMLMAYSSGLIKVTEKFKWGMMAAMGAISITYLINFVMGFFGMSVPFLHDAGPIGIGISLVIVGVAALNLVLNFDYIDQGARQQAPKYMEWYGGFGMLVSLVWLYMEILRLLMKLRSSDR